jgi:hypothetical protein
MDAAIDEFGIGVTQIDLAMGLLFPEKCFYK